MDILVLVSILVVAECFVLRVCRFLMRLLQLVLSIVHVGDYFLTQCRGNFEGKKCTILEKLITVGILYTCRFTTIYLHECMWCGVSCSG